VATSLADLGRRIERVDGPDQAKRSLFAKKTLILKRNQPAILLPLSIYFSKKTSTFTKINPQSVPSYELIFCLVGPAYLEWAKNIP